MLCDWDDQCNGPVTTVAVFGCLRMHVKEAYFCQRHVADWVNAVRSSMVHCKVCTWERLAEYLVYEIA